MDLDAIRLDVFKQTGLNIDKGDPFYAALIMLSSIADAIAHNNETSLAKIAGIANAASVRDEQTLETTAAKIQQAVAQVTGIQAGIADAAAKQARDILYPIVLSTKDVLKQLEDRKFAVTAALDSVQKTQTNWAENLGLAIGSVVLTLLITSGSAFYAGHVSAQTEIKKKAEWLDSEDGKYALQLRDAGSLKALATCNAGPFMNNWKKSSNGKVCIPYPTAGTSIGWRISQ